jgi:hypothetical protein
MFRDSTSTQGFGHEKAPIVAFWPRAGTTLTVLDDLRPVADPASSFYKLLP